MFTFYFFYRTRAKNNFEFNQLKAIYISHGMKNIIFGIMSFLTFQTCFRSITIDKKCVIHYMQQQ